MASLSAETAPTKMGTTFTECLHDCLVISMSRSLECYIMRHSIYKKKKRKKKGTPRILWQDMASAFPCYAQLHQHAYPSIQIFL